MLENKPFFAVFAVNKGESPLKTFDWALGEMEVVNSGVRGKLADNTYV